MNIGKSDHITLNISVDIEPTKVQAPPATFNYYKGDYKSLNENLASINWSMLLENLNTEQCWLQIKTILKENMNLHIPKTKPKSSFKNPPLWMNQDAKNAIKVKKKTWRKYQSQQTVWSAKKHREAQNQCTRKIKNIKKSFERKIVNEAKTDPKSFWKYVKSQTKYSESIPKLRKSDDTYAESDTDKASTFNAFFSSVFTQDDNEDPQLPNRTFKTSLGSFSVSKEDVINELSRINCSKSAGPDGLHPRLLFELRSTIAEPLCHIYNLSIKESYVPKDWKTAHVVPIFKKGDKSSPGNYRPVSLTSIVCKILETIIRTKLVEHLESNDLLYSEQYGFRKGRSCTLQLLKVMDDWTKSVNEGDDIDVIF